MDLETSALTLISTIHGRERRAQRAIDTRDLKAAVKYGVKTSTRSRYPPHAQRWKYTFADVVYITDVTSKIEVTSWTIPLPLERVVVKDRAVRQHAAAKERARQNPTMITSHSVLVVDQSASMKKLDVEGHRSRSDGVFYSVATEFVAKRLLSAEAGVTPFDVVTLIEMRDGAEVVFTKEPMTWVLFNKLVDRAKMGGTGSHGNYCPSLHSALSILRADLHADMALLLLFLSDGGPSDMATHTVASADEIIDLAFDIGAEMGARLTFGMVGYGSAITDFSVLEGMASRMEAAGATGTFHRSDLKAGSLGTSLSTMATSLTHTRTLLTTARGGGVRTKRSVSMARFVGAEQAVDETKAVRNYTTSDNDLRRVELVWSKTERKFVWDNVSFLERDATGIVCNEEPFGHGAERLVYQMQETDAAGSRVGVRLVAKDSIHAEDQEEMLKFHFSFVKTQSISANLATKFNDRLDRCVTVGREVPRITFLPCSVYWFTDDTGAWYGYLAEKELDDTLYTKWNDNAGGVKGQRPEKKANEEEPQDKGGSAIDDMNVVGGVGGMGMIMEGGSEDEDEDEDEESEGQGGGDTAGQAGSRMVLWADETKEGGRVGGGGGGGGDGGGGEDGGSEKRRRACVDVLDSDVPQAFTHYTYFWSKRWKMVCDLQGVLNSSCTPPLFELTDPCIHYESKRGRKHVYGRADRGRKGMKEFFKTHKCNALCNALGFANSYN